MNSIFSFFTRRHINHDNASVVISFGMYNFTCSFIRYSNDSIIFCSTEAYIKNIRENSTFLISAENG